LRHLAWPDDTNPHPGLDLVVRAGDRGHHGRGLPVHRPRSAEALQAPAALTGQRDLRAEPK